MKIKQQLLRTIGAWAALLVFMFTFQPNSLPVVLLIVPFVLLFFAFYASWHLFSLLVAHFATKTRTGRSRRYLGMAVSMSAVLLVVLQSLGQLTLRDILTVVGIIFLGYVYLTRNKFMVSRQKI